MVHPGPLPGVGGERVQVRSANVTDVCVTARRHRLREQCAGHTTHAQAEADPQHHQHADQARQVRAERVGERFFCWKRSMFQLFSFSENFWWWILCFCMQAFLFQTAIL